MKPQWSWDDKSKAQKVFTENVHKAAELKISPES